jgi:hypothetical protein
MVLDPTGVGDNQSLWPWSVVVGIAPSLPFCLSLQLANKAIIVASTKRPAYTRKNLQPSLLSLGQYLGCDAKKHFLTLGTKSVPKPACRTVPICTQSCTQ